MIQLAFFALLIVTLIAGAFSYFPLLQGPIRPLKYVLDSSGITQEDTVNTSKTEEINMVTSNGLTKIHKKMDNIALMQKDLMVSLNDQVRLLKTTNKDAGSILNQALQNTSLKPQDLLQIQALASSIQDQDRLLVSRGQDIIALNDKINADRQELAEELEASNVATSSYLASMQQRYNSLQANADDLFDRINQYCQNVTHQVDNVPGQLDGVGYHLPYADLEALRIQLERSQELMDKEKEAMVTLHDNQMRMDEQMQEEHDKQELTQEMMKDSMQRTQDLIRDERQREKDQQMWTSQP